MTLRTDRMRLVPATAALIRAEIEDRQALEALLDAMVPESWPPDILADALPWFLQELEDHPSWAGWLNWYGLTTSPPPRRPVLVGSAGFTGPPREGLVEIGYSVLPEFQRQGYASEMVRALIDWAFAQPGVRRIIANTTDDNAPSVRLLSRAGFSKVGAGAEPNSLRFELRKPGE